MRLIVKQGDQAVREFQFTQGPIYIGRQSSNHVHLPDKSVSKRHAAILDGGDGKWMVKDLGSANKTYLNDKVIKKAQVKTGDYLRITDFTLEINLEEISEPDKTAYMEDTLQMEATLTTPLHETVVRKPDAHHAPAMRLAAKRLTDFSQATEKICQVKDLDELLLCLLDITTEQFSAFRCWCALRKEPAGPMTRHAGRRRDGRAVQLDELQLREKITQAVEKGQSLVLPRVSAQMESKDRIRSAIIASIIRPTGCCGVLYVDNAMVHEHYSLSDLDYLMFLAMHTAAVLGKL